MFIFLLNFCKCFPLGPEKIEEHGWELVIYWLQETPTKSREKANLNSSH